MKHIAALVLAVFIFAVVAAGGCSSSSTPSIANSPTPTPSVSGTPTMTPSPTPPPSPTPTAVNFVILAHSSIPPTIDPTFGSIEGFGQATAAPSATPLPTVVSKVVTVHCNQTIQFYNLDRSHVLTASLLGPANGANWPNWNNVNAPNSNTPQFTAGTLTPITYPQFSTTLGVLGSGFSTSFVYSTGAAAATVYFGDYFNYTANPMMRTVVNILCP